MSICQLLLPAIVAGTMPLVFQSALAADAGIASNAVNSLGLDLLGAGRPGAENTLISPYSIQSALAMTYAGAEGQTREEMAKTLHYPGDEAALHASFGALRTALEEIERDSVALAERAKAQRGQRDTVVLSVANRLFGQKGHAFREPFLSVVEKTYKAPLESVDFFGNPDKERLGINRWVAERTQQRILDLIPSQGITKDTRLVLVNAVYLKAPWESPFPEKKTQPQPFRMAGGGRAEVPTMVLQADLGYARHDDFTMVSVPYSGGALQFAIFLPDKVDGLAELEAKLSTQTLASAANLTNTKVILHLPKFKMAPPVMKLGDALVSLGMKSPFDKPPGSANFDRMAPRRPDDYLYISEVFHKTFLDLDEKGTEAAAATAVVVMRAVAFDPDENKKPVEVRVDRPFLFAIQHRASGACLFLGRMTKP